MRPRTTRILALASVALAGASLTACGRDEPRPTSTVSSSSASTSTSTASTAPPSSAPATTATGGSRSDGPDSGGQASDALEDGQHVVYITALDESADTMTVDLVELLTGQAAVDAYLEDTGQPLDGEEFYLRNRNDLLRTLPADPTAGPYSIIDAESCCDPIDVGFAGLAAVRAQDAGAGATDAPFTIVVEGGRITSAVQMYVP